MNSTIRWMSGLALAACLGACGGEAESETTFSVVVPWTAPLESCDEEGVLRDSMQAFLKIGGHSACDLTVDSSTLAAAGTCEKVTVGIIRPLMIIYWIEDQTRSTHLAYNIGWVDLQKSNLPQGDTVEVDLTGNESDLIYTPQEVEALPAHDAEPTTELDKARKWAADEIRKLKTWERPDWDCDGIANLNELCDRGLAFFDDPPCD